MFGTVFEKVVVGVLTAVLLAMIYWVWNEASSYSKYFTFPQGSIIMADRDCAALGPRWAKASFDGRFPIGAGRGQDAAGIQRTFVPLAEGGDYSVTLEIANLPPHRHSLRTGYDFDAHGGLAGGLDTQGIFMDFDNPNADARQDGGHGILPNVLESVGSDQPLDILPPYKVVNFCIYQ